MTTAKTYTPKADSLAASVVHFFHGNPDEELTLDDISDKFDAGRNNIHTQLARAVEAGLLERGTNEDGEYIYTAGKAINAPKAGAELTTALAVGARVKILPSATGKKESRWIGKTGTVQRQVGPEAWDVCFTAKVARPITGKNVGEFQSFHVTELEVEAE